MANNITEHIQRGEELREQILLRISEIPTRLDPKAERSHQAIQTLSEATRDLIEWLNASLDMIEKGRPDDYEPCMEKYARIIDSVDAKGYTLLFLADSVYATVSSDLCYIIGVLKSISKSDPIIWPSEDSIFIVHGHNLTLRDDVRDYVESELGHNTVVLSDEPDGGRFVLEKFIDSANECGYAIVLMTADDQCISGNVVEERARQNVIFEYGFFVGRLGKANICIILDPGVELPSDVKGITRINSKDWKARLKTEIDHWYSSRRTGGK